MENKRKGDMSILEDLHENLNPDYSYILFESYKMPEEEVDFSEVSTFISKLNFLVAEEKIFRDHSRGTSIMMLRLRPDSEIDMQEMLDLKSPDHFSYYIFRKNKQY